MPRSDMAKNPAKEKIKPLTEERKKTRRNFGAYSGKWRTLKKLKMEPSGSEWTPQGFSERPMCLEYNLL